MWELIIVSIVKTHGNESFREEPMPNKEICLEVLQNFKFQSVEISENATGQLMVYCRPKIENSNNIKVERK